MRNAWDRYEKAKVRVIGVSADSVQSHQKFAQEHKLPFSLIADEDKSWARAFGVPSRLGFHARRSFLIDQNHKIAKVYPDVDPGVHAVAVLKDVEGL